MFARIEVAVRPDLLDSAAQGLLRKIELVSPSLRRKIRWGRFLDVYWLDVPVSREEVITTVTEACWDKVLQWVFTGNLIPSAAGKTGSLEDLMQLAPNRPGKFWGIERRYRAGVTDNVGRTLHEAFEIVLGRKVPEARTSSGALFVLEGPELDEDSLAAIARDVFSNELIETWTIVPEEGLKKNDRFHQERIKNDLPRVAMRGPDRPVLDRIKTYELENLSDGELSELSRVQLWALNLEEMKVIRDYFASGNEIEKRASSGLHQPTDVELEVIAQTWSEHCKHKIFNATLTYEESGESEVKASIPATINSLFKTTISATTADLPKPWLISVFHDNAGICAFDEEDAFCIKVETHNSPSALDPYGGALTGIVGVNRDILGCGMGAKPIFNTDVFCVAPLDYAKNLPDGLLHPRRILDGIRRGVEHGGNKSGIPTVNGALVFDERYLGKPLVYCGTGGLIPRQTAGIASEVKKVVSGDRVCMIGGRIGKDGIHGATFSSLALESSSPSTAVQLGDPLTQKRMSDFILEARDLGLYRAITDNGAGGLSSSVGEMARLSGGATIDLALAKTKYPGLKPYELVISESQERMTVAVPKDRLQKFVSLAERRGVEVSDLGEFTESGYFDIFFGEKRVAQLNLDFLHDGVPRLAIRAEWRFPEPKTPPAVPLDRTAVQRDFEAKGGQALLDLLGHPNIASKEWLIRQYDHEVQGTSVVKPLHSTAPSATGSWNGTPMAYSGPNDAGVLRPKAHSDLGLAVGCGINPKLSDVDPYLMAQSVVDEAVRNILCVGAEFGKPESVLALVDNFCWPDPVEDSLKAGALVRACFGMREAALALGAPLVSGKDSMKNDFRGRVNGEPVKISVPPTLLMTAVGRVADIKFSRTSDFKTPGDVIYLLGPGQLRLVGSEFSDWAQKKQNRRLAEFGEEKVAIPNWEQARILYQWIGGAWGKQQTRMKSLHDVSDGGVLVAVAEGILARGLGASVQLPAQAGLWESAFGEGFHTFVASVSAEDRALLEDEWNENQVPFRHLGQVESHGRLEVFSGNHGKTLLFDVGVQRIRSAWLKEGYWE